MKSIDIKLAALVGLVFLTTAATVLAQTQNPPPSTNVGAGAITTQTPNQTGAEAAKAGKEAGTTAKEEATEKK